MKELLYYLVFLAFAAVGFFCQLERLLRRDPRRGQPLPVSVRLPPRRRFRRARLHPALSHPLPNRTFPRDDPMWDDGLDGPGQPF